MGPSRSRCAEKDENMRAQGCMFEHPWALRGWSEGSGFPRRRFGRQRGVSFLVTLTEKCDLCISTPLSNGIASLAGPGNQVGATCAPKVAPDRSKVPSKGQVAGARTVKFGQSARSCCQDYGNQRKSVANHGNSTRAKSKVYLGDKTYV